MYVLFVCVMCTYPSIDSLYYNAKQRLETVFRYRHPTTKVQTQLLLRKVHITLQTCSTSGAFSVDAAKQLISDDYQQLASIELSASEQEVCTNRL